MAATFQWHSRGRLLLNVVTGGDADEQRAFGDFLDKEERYGRTGEFLEIVRGLWDGETVDYEGEHLQVEGGDDPPPARPGAARSTSAAPRRPAIEVAAAPRRRLPHLGRAARRGRREDRARSARPRPSAAARSASASAST